VRAAAGIYGIGHEGTNGFATIYFSMSAIIRGMTVVFGQLLCPESSVHRDLASGAMSTRNTGYSSFKAFSTRSAWGAHTASLRHPCDVVINYIHVISFLSRPPASLECGASSESPIADTPTWVGTD